jgi:predicted double-glycine peptidase
MKTKALYVFSWVFSVACVASPTLAVPITPYRTLRYQGVIGQTNYYTCGPAAVATLLTYYYGQPTAESEILELSEKAMEGSGKSPEEKGVTALALRQAVVLLCKGWRIITLDPVF